jgi:hypothetical protein
MGGPAAPRAGDDARARGLEAGPAEEARRPIGPDDPGPYGWRIPGDPHETRVARHRYRREAPGQPTILTSGRRIGAPSLHLPRKLVPAGEQSAVRALVCVNPRGRPTEVRIADGTGRPELDRSVARELLTDRFRPLRQGGRAVPFCEEVTVVVSS